MPGTLFTIWLVSPCAMNPAPRSATRIGLPCSSRAWSAWSTRIIGGSPSDRHAPADFRLDLAEQLPHLVLVGDRGHRQRPAETQPRIGGREAAFRGRRVELADLV